MSKSNKSKKKKNTALANERPKLSGSQSAEGSNQSSTTPKQDDSPKGSFFTKPLSIVTGVIGFVAALTGIWAATGYNFRDDVVNKPRPLELEIGTAEVKENESCSVIFAIDHSKNDHPKVLGLPILIRNSSNKSAHNVVVTFTYEAPLNAFEQSRAKITGLGLQKDLHRETSAVGKVSTTSIVIPKIDPNSGHLAIEAMLWSLQQWEVDKPNRVRLSVSADDTPTRRQFIDVWVVMAVGKLPDAQLALPRKSQSADHAQLVYFENYNLVVTKNGDQSPLYSFQTMEDIKYSAIKTEK